MKKVLSLVLVIAMVLSSMSFAFASTFEDVTGDYEKAIDTLSALGVIDGYEDGTYRPEKTVTRAEMAKLMVITLGYGDLVAGSKSNFSDTQGHWADAYIALAAGKGIVVGDGNGKFRPDATVSYDEVYTMLVRGLGYTDTCNELKGMSWPTNFKVKAADLDITDDVVMTTTGADRGGVAQAIFNALQATLVTVDSEGDVTLVVDRDDAQVELFTRLADLDNDYVVSEELLDSSNKNYAGDLVDLAPYMFQSLKVYLNDDDEVVYVKSSNSLVYEGEIDDVVYDNVNDETTVSIEDANGKIKNVVFDGIVDTDDIALAVFENGAEKENTIEYTDLLDTETIKIVAMDDHDLLAAADDDGKIDSDEVQGFVTTLRTEVVRIEKEYVDGKDSIDGIDLPLDSDDEVDLENITVTGDATALEDIAIDDIVVSYVSDNDEVLTLVVTRNSVEGKVTKVTDKNTVSIDGTSYDLSSKSLVADWALDLGDEGIFYLDQAGEIADYDGDSVGPTDYAVVIASEDGTIDEKYGYSIDEYPTLKLATQEGEEVVYEVAVEIDEDDATITDSAQYNDNDLFTDADVDNDVADAGNKVDAIDIEDAFTDTVSVLIKYSLDADGRIDDIEFVENVSAYEAGTGTNDVDLDSDDLADGAIIFDAGDDFAVVDVDSLNTEFVAHTELNDDGDIEVLVVNKGEVDEAASTIYAYLNKVTMTYNEDGDKVNQFVMYVDGQKFEVLADDDSKAVNTYNYAISFDYNGNVVDSSDVTYDVTGEVATATAISASKGKIELSFAAGTTYDDDNDTTTAEVALNDGWYTLSEHATIVEVDPTTTVAYGVDQINDLYDIDENDQFEVFFNSDGDIDLIVITQQ